jgi:hypothetical protein
MKKLLLILVFLAIAVPVSAKRLVIVYNMKQNNSNIDWDDMSQQWSQTKDTYTSYVIVEPIGSGTAKVFSVDIWQEKESGKTTKYASAQSVGEMELIEAQIGKKLMWIISFEDGNNRVMLTGEAKNAKIGTTPYTFASKFAGLSIWDRNEDGGDRYVGSSNITMSLNSSYTKRAYDDNLDGEGAMNALLNYLVTQLGYTEDTP